MPGDASVVVDALNLRYLSNHPVEGARCLENMPVDESVPVLSSQPYQKILPVFERLSPSLGSDILQHLNPDWVRDLMSDLNPNYLISVLSHLEPEDKEKCMSLADQSVRSELEILISYPENSAGRLMDPRVFSFHGSMTVKEGLDRFRQLKPRPGRTVYLVDDEHRLTEKVEVQDIAVAGPDQLLHEVSQPIQYFIKTLSLREDIVKVFEESKTSTLPVVDFSGRLVGIVRYTDLVKMVEELAANNLLTMVGASKDERALSKASFVVKKRLPWLQINLLTSFLAASVVGLFEETIAQFTALAVLLPVVAGQSGNAGAQALAVTMRGLALREVTLRQWLGVLRKETFAGIINGIGIAVTLSIGVYLWSGSVGLTFISAVSMVLSMVIACMAGALVPIGLIRVGQDPAQSSSIVLTTVTDIVGFFSFLGIATALSHLL